MRRCSPSRLTTTTSIPPRSWRASTCWRIARRPIPTQLAGYLFVEQQYSGNDVDYSDPRNSYLDVVLDRRLGIPITLSILMMEVGRRRGVALSGIGMPGHFLVGGPPGVYYDPFHAGARLDVAGVRGLFAAQRGDASFDERFLEPVGPRARPGPRPREPAALVRRSRARIRRVGRAPPPSHPRVVAGRAPRHRRAPRVARSLRGGRERARVARRRARCRRRRARAAREAAASAARAN